MGVKIYTEEFNSTLPASRLFRALVLESHIVIPKAVPEGIKSVEFIQGDGGVGSIKQTNFAEGRHIKHIKHRIDALDKENMTVKYTLIESDIDFDKIEFVVYEMKIVATAEGGSVLKMSSEYHIKEGAELSEEDIKKGKEKGLGLVKAVGEYLKAHPEVCA